MNNQNAIYEVTKEKSKIRGYWKDENGKLYKDNIKLYHPLNAGDYEAKLYLLFTQGEKAVFVRGKSKSFVISQNGDMETLNHKLSIVQYKLSHTNIKSLLARYNGLTIFDTGKEFIIEIWKE